MSKTKTQQITKLKNQADQAYTTNQYEKAYQLYSKAIQLDQTNPALYNNRSLTLIKLQKPQQALADGKKSIEIDNKFIKGYLRIIQAYLELDLPEEALKLVNQIQQLFQKQELQELKQKITKIIASIPTSPLWKILVQWLYNQGAYFKKLMVSQFSENYRGIVAKQNIKKKERILYIPLNRMITLEMGKQLPISKKILARGVQLQSPKHTFLALYLLYEMNNEQSQWKPYIDLLPKQFPSFPIFFVKQQLQLLQGSPFLFMVHQKVIDLKTDYDTLCKHEETFSKFSFKDFCWARTSVCSRIFGLTINGVKTDALVPFADMINHRIPKQSSWVFVQKQNGFIMQAIDDIQKGQEVFDSYGKKCNTRFLLNYGFVIPNNQMNEVPFKMMLDVKDPLLSTKIQMIGQKPSAKVFKVSAVCGDGTLYELLGYLRFRLVDDPAIINAIKTLNRIGQIYVPSRTPPITKQLQIKCWQYIKQVCQQSLKKYPTTYQQDAQILLNPNLLQNHRNCLILIIGQKLLYNHFIDMSNKMKMVLSMSPQQLKNYINPQMNKYRDYIQKIVVPLVIKQ